MNALLEHPSDSNATMPSIAELESTLARLQKEYADIRIISQSNPGPIMDRRMIQRDINRIERQLLELQGVPSVK